MLCVAETMIARALLPLCICTALIHNIGEFLLARVSGVGHRSPPGLARRRNVLVNVSDIIERLLLQIEGRDDGTGRTHISITADTFDIHTNRVVLKRKARLVVTSVVGESQE